MGGKSIAARATAFRQRMNHVKRPEAYKEDERGNFIDKKVSVEKFTCRQCGVVKWFVFVRCPDCQAMR